MIFLSEAILKVGHGTDSWILDEPLIYQADSSELITVPAGFSTDLASIPRPLQAVIPLNGKHRAAAIVHDYLYAIQDRTRAQADAIFLEAMKACRVRYTQRYAMYWGVRIGGWVPWNERLQKNG